MPSKTDLKYSGGAMTLHWLIALAVIFMLFWGRYMTDLPKGSFERLEAFQLHQSIGLTILMLTLIHIIWRLKHPVPPQPAGLKAWEATLRRATHVGFYVLLIIIPLSGWSVASTSSLGVPIEYFGQFDWPFISFLTNIENKQDVHEAFEKVHEYLGWGMIALLVLHLAGIFKHTFILKDALWRRMVPGK